MKVMGNIRLQYYNGKMWETISEWPNALTAWISLGDDTLNYRTIDKYDEVIAENKLLTKESKKLCRCMYGSRMTSSHPCKHECQNNK